MPAPLVTDVTSSSMTLSWRPPLNPNGNITTYRLLLGSSVLFSGPALSFSVQSLTPYRTYAFAVQACNSVACVLSDTAVVQTLQAGW